MDGIEIGLWMEWKWETNMLANLGVLYFSEDEMEIVKHIM